MTESIVIPYCPRPLQAALHHQMDTHRWGVAVCHRRFGKSVAAVNQLVRAAVECSRVRPRYAYIGPTYRQAKAVVWDYLRQYALPIPGVVANETELRVDGPGDWQVRLYGADNPDALRGLYFDGCVMDEYGLMAPHTWQVVRPCLSDRRGWCWFIGTPNGRNDFHVKAQQARQTTGWGYAEYRASQTGILSADELESARAQLTTDEYLQEYECSFDASVRGAIYAAELRAAREAGRIGRVPYDPVLPVDTAWDLGVGDATAIWFVQVSPAGEIRLIDYLEASGEGLPYYAHALQCRPYTYGVHWAPHDIEVRELGSGRSRLEAARALGLYMRVVPKMPLAEGIHAARMILPRCWFDADRTAAGLDALGMYRKMFHTRLKEYTETPEHDWASHGADAFRYLALAVGGGQPPRPRLRAHEDEDEDEADRPRWAGRYH